MKPIDACPLLEELEGLAAGRLEEAASSRISAHMTTCATCSRQLDELRSDRELGERLRRALGGVNETALPSIEGFRVIREVGRGGMGVVYEAEQLAPKRRVALKVVRGVQYVDAQTLRLFQREIRVLARLEHPGIASLYGAGETRGEHWFAMEFVDGKPLTLHARGLATDAKLERFQQLCDAIDHAHRHGVVHRDLKPSNVLVTESGRVQVLDFGLAKITDADVSIATEAGHIRGTLAYMSPEQARGDPAAIGLSSDVYSLGVILYELLCDALPIDTSGVPIHEAARRVALEAPRKPSAIVPALRGDLETIVSKALEKDPHRRYASTAALAEDVRRFRANEVILARPPSSAYELSKLVSRHKVPFALATVVLVGAVTTAVWTSILYSRESHLLTVQERLSAERESALESEKSERARAEAAAEHAREKSQLAERNFASLEREAAVKREGMNFLIGIFTEMRTREARTGKMTAVDLLKRGIARLAARQDKSPYVRISLLETIGAAASNAGLFDDASKLLEEGLALVREHAPRTAQHAVLAVDLGLLRRTQGRQVDSLALLREGAAIYAEVEGEAGQNAMTARVNLAQGLREAGQWQEAVAIGRELLSVTPIDDTHLSRRLNLHATVGLALSDMREFDEARHVLEAGITEYGDNRPRVELASVINSLAVVLFSQDQFDAARSRFEEVLEMRLQLLEPDHEVIANSYNNLAAVVHEAKDFAKAEEYLQKAQEIQVKRFGANSVNVSMTEYNRASNFLEMGRFQDAEPLARHALETRRAAYGAAHPNVADTLSLIGALALKRGDLAAARSALDEALVIFDAKHGRKHPDTIEARCRLAQFHVLSSQWDDARALVAEVKDDARATKDLPAAKTALIASLEASIESGGRETSETSSARAGAAEQK